MAKNLRVKATRSDGAHSREAILNAAARLATVEGLEGMSIGRLAEYTGMSKSGLYAHFGSKEELQLATIDTANQIFRREVIEPTIEISDPVQRVRALCDEFLAHLERDVFPGGCFFVSAMAEFDTRPGEIRDRLRVTTDAWLSLFTNLIEQAQREGSIEKSADASQLAWEIDSYLLMANLNWVLSRDQLPLQRARDAIENQLKAAAAR